MFQVFDQVQTIDGRRGLIRAIDGRHATVMIAGEGDEFYDLDDLTIVAKGPEEAIIVGQLGEFAPFQLRLTAQYLRHAYRYDLRSGLSNARVEPKLHQVFIAHRVTNKLQPRMILADEVGLGKTIEAGLILKELRAREVLERVLIVCPASLQYQWQNELRSKFNEDFEIMNAASAKYLSQGGQNPFTRRDNLITSLNFAQNEKRAEQILEAPWDLVIFDEAHRVRRSRRGKNKQESTQLYRLADELKEIVNGLLLLTATPMQLDPFELYSLVELVEPGLFQSFDEYDQRRRDLPLLNDLMRGLREWPTLETAEREELADKHSGLIAQVTDSPLTDATTDAARNALMDALASRHPLADTVIRNRKAEIGGFAGRQAKRFLVDLTTEESALYEDVADYLRYEYNQALVNKQNALGFLMVTYQKMLASSPFAILQSFKRRVKKLSKGLQGTVAKGSGGKSGEPLDDLLDDLDGAELLEALADTKFTISEALLIAELQGLQNLIQRLENLEVDSKVDQLLDALEEIWTEHPDEKVVIFTTFRDTQAYLLRRIQENLTIAGARPKVAIFNGQMNAEDKEEAVRRFRADHNVFIATEAGGEGRNLQFAHILINYDLPWNPMKVEQRIGRLDRIGQKRKVFIYNLACRGTVEERVLAVLDNRIRLFEESVGSLDPILGELEGEFAKLVMSDKKGFLEEFEGFADDVERRTRRARENERLLADFALDRASFRRDDANELLGQDPMATSSDLARFVGDALRHYGGTLMPHDDGGAVVTLSSRLASRMHGTAPQQRGVFDPKLALELEEVDFFAFGHDLVERIIDLPLKDEDGYTTGRFDSSLEGGPYLETVYALRADTNPPVGRIIRHLVGADGQVHRSVIRSMPDAGTAAAVDTPPWSAQAMAASRTTFQTQLAEMRREVRSLHGQQIEQEASRAERIYLYRRGRLEHLIAEQQRWIEDARRSDNERARRILPAREGRLRKDQERLRTLEAESEQEVMQIRAREVGVTGQLWVAAIVSGT